MIQAAQPNQLHNPDEPEQKVISKVPGFGKPVEQPTHNTVTTHEKQRPEWVLKFYHWWHKVALVLLIGHGLLGLWESIYFMAVEYKELNNLLEIHQIETTEVNHLLSRAIITFVTTFVNVLFAVRLSKVKETTAHNVDLIVATFLIITTKLIQNLLVQLDLLNYFIGIFSK